MEEPSFCNKKDSEQEAKKGKKKEQGERNGQRRSRDGVVNSSDTSQVFDLEKLLKDAGIEDSTFGDEDEDDTEEQISNGDEEPEDESVNRSEERELAGALSVEPYRTDLEYLSC